MSTEKGTKNPYFLIGIIVVFALLIPFFFLDPGITSVVVIIFFAAIIIAIDPFKGLFVLLLLRPLLDYFTDNRLFWVGPVSVNVAALLGVIPIAMAGFIASSKIKKLKNIPLIKQWVFFLLIAGLSTLFTIDLSTSIAEIIRLLTFLSLYLLAYFSINTTKKTNQLVDLLIFSSFVPAFVAIIQYFNKSGLSLSFNDIPNRLFGTFAHPNLFAFYLVFVVGLLLYKYLRHKKQDPKFIWLAIIGIFALLIMQTYTRGAWIAFVLVVLIMGSLQYRKMLAVSIGLFLGAYLLLSPIQDRVNESLSSNQSSSVQWRFAIWQDTIEYIYEKPLTGRGAGITETYIDARRGMLNESSAVHNDFLKIALEYGIVGLFAFVLLIFSLIFKTFHIFSKLKQKTKSRTLVLAFGSIIAAFAVSSFADNILDTTALQWAIWSLAGAIMATFHPSE